MNTIYEQDYTAKKIDFSIWKRLYGYTLQNRRLVCGVLLALVVVAAVDTLYPLFSAYAIDHFVTPRDTNGLLPFAFVYGGTCLLQGLCTVLFINLSGRLEMRMSYDIRNDAFLKLQNLSFSYYDRTPVGYIMARMVSDVARLSELVAWSLVDVLWAAGYIAGSIVSMFLLSPKLAAIVLSVVPPLALISVFLQKRVLHYQRKVRKQNSRITGAFNEGIMGAVTTKTLVREDANCAEFNKLTSHMRQVSIRSALVSACFFPIIMTLGAVGTALALSLGSESVLQGSAAFVGAITAGTLIAFISYSMQLFDPIQQLAGIVAELLGAQASAERVITLLDTEPTVVDRPDVIARDGDILHPKRQNWTPIAGHVTFEYVSFSYSEGETVLKDFSLDVPAGTTVALVGETGAGKSTIVNLICRFYEPTSGRILIDGVDYRERSQLSLQSNLGYVLQTPHLFSGTIADNIRFGVPDASMESVREAARLVHADDFILRQANGYNTEVGEGGVLLSTGQKQLISFARVVLKNPQLFVLDEATSSIDTETEQAIQSAITHVLAGRTSFIVAHRLSTIRSADIILVIRDGRITESGTHAELMRLGGYYSDLYTHQFAEQATISSLHGQ